VVRNVYLPSVTGKNAKRLLEKIQEPDELCYIIRTIFESDEIARKENKIDFLKPAAKMTYFA
jgi:hypothetical protein